MKSFIKNLALLSIVWIVSSCSLAEFFAVPQNVETAEEASQSSKGAREWD